MDMPIEQFNQTVGEIMMYCQCIEENIKRIFAHMQPGNSQMNRLHINEQRLTMGQIITAMKELDRSRSKPFFSDHDYEYLFLVTKTRNEYAHNVYAHFCYLDVEEEFERSYNRCCANLMKDRNWLFKLYEAVEDARLLYEGKLS